METWESYKAKGIEGRLEAARLGKNPTVIAKLPSGYAVLCDAQVSLGWCILVADPAVLALNDLPRAAQAQFLHDMARLGDAVQAVTGCYRLNYSIYGNTDPFLHAHVVPRYLNEPEKQRRDPLWLVSKERWNLPEVQFSPETHGELQRQLREKLLELE